MREGCASGKKRQARHSPIPLPLPLPPNPTTTTTATITIPLPLPLWVWFNQHSFQQILRTFVEQTFYRPDAACPSCYQTNSTKALKAGIHLTMPAMPCILIKLKSNWLAYCNYVMATYCVRALLLLNGCQEKHHAHKKSYGEYTDWTFCLWNADLARSNSISST